MFWKNWPYWLRGIIIGFMCWGASFLFAYLCFSNCGGWQCNECIKNLWFYFWCEKLFLPFVNLQKIIGNGGPSQALILAQIINIISVLAVGAILGLIFQKVKNTIKK